MAEGKIIHKALDSPGPLLLKIMEFFNATLWAVRREFSAFTIDGILRNPIRKVESQADLDAATRKGQEEHGQTLHCEVYEAGVPR